MKLLVLFEEGEGDVLAAPILVKRILTELNAWDCMFIDNHPFIVGDVNKLIRNNHRNWIRWLGAAAKRKSLGAVLLLLDGDVRKVQGQPFCAVNVAEELANRATQARGGESKMEHNLP